MFSPHCLRAVPAFFLKGRGDKAGAMDSMIGCSAQRIHGNQRGQWLVTMHIGTMHACNAGGHIHAAYPQNWAVVDDFGNLVFVRGWR